MNKLKLDLIPSKPLLLSPQVLETLSKTFERHEVRILEKRLNKALRLEISFDRRREVLKQKIDEFQQKARKTRESSRPGAEEKLMVFKDIIKGLRAEANVLSNNFLLKITEDQVIIETSLGKISELSFFCSQIYFETIISHICEAYAEIGENISLMEKERS